MSYSQSWTDESVTTPTNSSDDQEKTNSSSEEKDLCTEQILVHRWFLSDIQSLNNREENEYLQSSTFGCTGENEFLQWIIRFYPISTKKEKSLTSPAGNNNSPKENVSIPTNEEESLSDGRSYCAFEILRINGSESSSQTLFEINYQIYEIADDGILNLFKSKGRHQVHFHRALITLPRDTIFSISSNNILFSIKLTIYECSSTIGYSQSLSNMTRLSILSNISSRYSMIELSIGNIFWLLSIEKIFTDIIICSSDNQEFHVHRLIICTSCKKFISTNQQMNRIEIDSVNGIILQRILKYIYTNDIEISIGEFSIEDFRELLNAADLFELVQLKNILIKKSCNHITQKNCFELLQIADDKQIKILKNRILAFLCQQFPQIFNSDVWQQFCSTRPHLYNETFSSLIRLNHLQKSIIEQLQEKKS